MNSALIITQIKKQPLKLINFFIFWQNWKAFTFQKSHLNGELKNPYEFESLIKKKSVKNPLDIFINN